MSEPVESCTSSGPGADPDSSQSSVRCGDDDDTANMETVALDTTDIYQELVQADEAGHDMSISLDSDPGKEADLKRYFAHTPTDAAPCSFFDSLSVSTSPMMKSVSEASMVQAASSVQDAIPEALAQSRPLEESGLFFSVGETPGEEATAVIAQEALEGTVEFHSAPVLEEVESIQASSEPPADTRAASSADEGPSLSKFFSSDCSGGDQEGKAFFDVLAAEIAGGDKSRRSSGSASPLSMVQESCLIADVPPTDDGDLCAYDNWLPSAATREFLARLATSEPGTVFPDREHLTMPGIIVEEPQETYGDLALFFYDRYGGNLVAVLWKPHAFQPLPFKVSQIGGRTLNAEGKMVPNVEAVLEDFSTLGKGLVTSVETRTSKWTV
ncbi:putative D-alanyl-D-alanine carboxypeptidase [Ixodes scapularis]